MKLVRAIVALALMLAAAPLAWAEDVVGKWTGVVKAPDGDIPLNVSVTKDAEGKLAATAESPTQAPGMAIPTENVVSDGAKLSFEVSIAQGSYSGAWDPAKKAWVGTWKQGGMDMPLDLARAP